MLHTRSRMPNALVGLCLFGTVFLSHAVRAQEGDAGRNAGAETRADVTLLEAVEGVVDGAIRPGYRAFGDAAEAAVSRIETLCSEPGEDALQDARDSFGTLISAFARIEFVRFGPIREDNRLERILFFPDPRGVTRRQVEQLLADEDASAIRPETLAEKSVAVQGLPALEFVLFGDGSIELSGANAGYRCAYGEAIAQNLSAMASRITDAWADDGGFVERLLDPSPDDPSYRNASDSLGEIVSIFVDGLEIVADQRLRPALGTGDDPVRPYLFLFYRSDNALNALKANMQGLASLFEAARFADILPAEETYLDNSIAFEFEQARSSLDELRPPLSEVVEDDDAREQLDYLTIVTNSLRSQFADQLSPAFGLSSGFSSLDGD